MESRGPNTGDAAGAMETRGSLGGRGWRMPCKNRVRIKGMVNAENMVSGSRGRRYPAC